MKSDTARWLFVKLNNTKFSENPFSSSRVACACVRIPVYCIYTKTSGHKTILSVTIHILLTGLL